MAYIAMIEFVLIGSPGDGWPGTEAAVMRGGGNKRKRRGERGEMNAAFLGTDPMCSQDHVVRTRDLDICLVIWPKLSYYRPQRKSNDNTKECLS